MRLPDGLKRLDDRVLGSRGPGTGGTRAGGRRSAEHEDVHPKDEERSVAKAEESTETTTETTTDPRTEAKTEPRTEPKTEKVERTTRTRRGRHDGDGDAGASSRGNGDGLQKVLATVWRISRLVFLALGLLLVLAIALTLLPANEDNSIVSNVLSWAETVAGPFKDVFTVKDEERMRIYNYALAAAVYFLLATVVSKLPTGGTRKKKG